MKLFLTILILLHASDGQSCPPMGVARRIVSNDKITSFLTQTTSHKTRLSSVPRGGAIGKNVAEISGKVAAQTTKSNDTLKKTKDILATTGNEFDIEDFSIATIIKRRLTFSDAAKGFTERLKNSTRLPYVISLVLSFVYFVHFSLGDASKCTNYQDGFCVTGLEIMMDDNGNPLIDPDNHDKIVKKCLGSNSHKWAWFEDLIFTIIAIILPFTKYMNESAEKLANRIAIPGIIIGHGYLHNFLSRQECYVPATGDLVEKSTKFYKIFVGSLTGMMYFLFSDLPEKRGYLFTLMEVIAISFVIVRMSLNKVIEGSAISAFFMTTQLIVSYLGAFHPNELASKLVGQTFIFPCAVSLVEFLNCEWLEKFGGHAWYDFFLHISVLASFLPSDWDLLDLFR